jgi:hypothetical protein
MPENGLHKTGQGNVKYNLVFFSTFEDLKLPRMDPWKMLEWSIFMNIP